MIYQLVALFGAFALSVLLTPVFRRLSLAVGLVDHPDAHRKLHREPVALCGGPTLLFSAVIAACTLPMFDASIRQKFLDDPWPIIGMAVGGLAIVILGMVDDRFTLRGRQKLFGQILIALWMVWTGYRISAIDVMGWQIDLAILVVPISLLWFLITINSLNLIDGADGLCSSVGWIASAGLAAMAAVQSHHLEGTLAAGLAGSLLGFLVYNFPPARVFLGDAGSMLVGLILGSIALRTSLKEATTVSLLGPVAIFAIPFFDSGMAILRRKLTGRSIFSTDRGHIHHSMIRRGLSNRGLVIAINAVCAITAAGALVGTVLKNEVIALIATLSVLGCLVASRAFGHAELRLLTHRLYSFCSSLVPRLQSVGIRGHQHTIRFQGNRSWETIWHALMEFAEKHDLSKIALDLNVPWLHEGFHASWTRSRLPDESHLWRSQLPVFAENRSLGRLSLAGRMDHIESVSLLTELAEMLEGLQPEVLKLASDQQPAPRAIAVASLEDSSESFLPASDADSSPNVLRMGS